jgi:hypothetical protein
MAKDSIGRQWQVATIQIDMNMPERFDLNCINEKGEKEFAYALNNTAIASPRILIAIMENYQQADGSIKIPDVLKPYFNKDEENSQNEADQLPADQLPAPADQSGIDLGIINNLNKPNQNNNSKTETKVDIDKKVRKGDKNELVYKIQIAVNNIARIRGINSFIDTETGKVLKFPIPLDSSFGNMTDSGLRFALPEYKSAGYATVRKAREQWVRSAGYFKRPFPTELSAVSNYADLKKIYDINAVKGSVPTIF